MSSRSNSATAPPQEVDQHSTRGRGHIDASRHDKSHSENFEFHYGVDQVLDTLTPPVQSLNQNHVHLPAARHMEDVVPRMLGLPL